MYYLVVHRNPGTRNIAVALLDAVLEKLHQERIIFISETNNDFLSESAGYPPGGYNVPGIV